MRVLRLERRRREARRSERKEVSEEGSDDEEGIGTFPVRRAQGGALVVPAAHLLCRSSSNTRLPHRGHRLQDVSVGSKW